MKTVERAACTIGGLLILSGLVHLAILLMSGGSWEGPLSFRKPTTFGLSFGLTLINVTVIASFVSLTDRTRTLLLGIFAAACVLETFLVSLQAWRGVPSHFNLDTPFDTVVSQSLAVGGFTLVVIIVLLTIAALRDRSPVRPTVRLAIRAGLVALVGAQVAGGVMIGTGMQLDRRRRPGARVRHSRMAEARPRRVDARHSCLAFAGVADLENGVGRAHPDTGHVDGHCPLRADRRRRDRRERAQHRVRCNRRFRVEGWYTGDAARMERALHPELAKRIWIDYMHMAKWNGRWVIVNVLWELKPAGR